MIFIQTEPVKINYYRICYFIYCWNIKDCTWQMKRMYFGISIWMPANGRRFAVSILKKLKVNKSGHSKNNFFGKILSQQTIFKFLTMLKTKFRTAEPLMSTMYNNSVTMLNTTDMFPLTMLHRESNTDRSMPMFSRAKFCKLDMLKISETTFLIISIYWMIT